MASVIKDTLLERHSAAVLPELAEALTNGYTYALLSVEVNECPILETPIFVHCKIDRSGSMSDLCKDGMTKMKHTIHTLTNIMRFFSENETATIFVQVCVFDDKIDEIVPVTRVKKTNVDEIIESLNTIYARNSTNIELALKDSNTRIQEYSSQYPSHRVSHIFMTDGEATIGSSNIDFLTTLIDKTISSSFIAFGVQHNAKMLNAFGRVSPKTSNWLVEKLENAGLVYGEIINNELYIGADDVNITVYNGLIYDYTNDSFVETLDINTLVTESKKLYHVSTNDPNNCYVIIRGNSSITGEFFEETVPMLPVLNMNNNDNEIVTNDLTQHMFRLRAQQLMKIALTDEMQCCDPVDIFSRRQVQRSGGLRRQNAIGVFTQSQTLDSSTEDENVNHSIETVVEVYQEVLPTTTNPVTSFKNSLKEFKKSLDTYIKDNSLEENDFMQNIRDDIYITILTMNTTNQYMYVSARQSSQGRQQSYNVVDIEVPGEQDDGDEDSRDPNNISPQRHMLPRSHTNSNNTTPTMMRTMTHISQSQT